LSDIAAHDAKALGQRALMMSTRALGEPAAARAVEASRVHLVEIGECTVLLGEVADGLNPRHPSVYGVHRLGR